MNLKITNLAKIRKADIELNGITVIAGENNAGKSTVGKALFSIFNAMNHMGEKLENERENTVLEESYRILQNLLTDQGVSLSENRRQSYTLAKRLARRIVELEKPIDEKKICVALEDFLKENDLEGDGSAEFLENMETKLREVFRVSDEMVMREVITRWFRRIFEQQITPLVDEKPETYLTLEIKGKKIQFSFLEDMCCACDSQINILHEAFYIDNPFVIDSMSCKDMEDMKRTDAHLLEHLCKKNQNPLDGIFDVVMAQEKLRDIYSMLDQVITGEISENSDGEYYLKSPQYIEPLNIKNLSTGLKSFAIVKRLLEQGQLRERDVLILDEPEIHLHPEWQLLYAELIVLLQKKFELTLVITTHSPYFLDAIDVYTAKYGRTDKVNYYLAENDGSMSILHDVTQNIDRIYEKLSDPMQKLETMRNIYCTNGE